MFCLVCAGLIPFSTLHGQSCDPMWTVSVAVTQGSDSSDLMLVVDTAATFGWDAALDSLCPPDSVAPLACFLSEDTAYIVHAVPSEYAQDT